MNSLSRLLKESWTLVEEQQDKPATAQDSAPAQEPAPAQK